MSRYNISNVRAAFVDTKTGALTKFGIDVLQRISDVLGLPGGNNLDDAVSTDTYDSTSYAASIDNVYKRLDNLEQESDLPVVYIKELVNKVISGETFTATNNMRLKITGNSLIYLPKNPITDSEVHFIKFDTSKLTLDGNGKKINGKDSWIYYKSLLSRQIYFFKETDEWVIM